MSEVLANAAALFEKRLHRSGDLGRLGIELEIPVYSSRQIENRFEQRTARGKRLARVVGEFPAGLDALGTEDKLVSVQALLAVIADQRLDAPFPTAEMRRNPDA